MGDNIRIFFLLMVEIFVVCAAQTISNLKALKYYETLHVRDISHSVVKRSADGLKERSLEFFTLGRPFHLYLKESHDVLASGFRVVQVDGQGHDSPVSYTDELYHGSVSGQEDTWVQVYFDKDKTLIATIKTQNETYSIEPSWPHLPPSVNHTMLAYRASDLDLTQTLGPRYCSVPAAGRVAPAQPPRPRRTVPHSPALNTCRLLLVADHWFFTNMGQSNHYQTVSYLISLVDRTNNIYRQTVWGSGLTNMGFAIQEIRVHTQPTDETSSKYLYNRATQSWDTKKLLEALSMDRSNLLYCLVHLFTWTQFQDGSLGLSYLASADPNQQGGICSQGYSNLYLNTGWSTSVNRFNRRLLTQEAELVAVHEFGHNWGSEHDPETSVCAPSSFNGGKFVMYTYAVSGHDPNNRDFSECSRLTVGHVLQAKAHKCFSEQMHNYCGNSQVESGEQCDPGLDSSDPCCDSICRLRLGAVCSDVNSICCKSCQYAGGDTVCREALTCTQATSCSGSSDVCPHPRPKPDGTECVGKGQCREGECVPYCESRGLESCACDSVEDSCKWCCRVPNSTCSPHKDAVSGVESILPEGMPCIQGYCTEQGQCQRVIQDLTERLWSIIEQLGPNRIAAFMKANIVGTVMILSLLVWVPISCVVCQKDRKMKKREKELEEWHQPWNTRMVPDPDRVRPASNPMYRRFQHPSSAHM